MRSHGPFSQCETLIMYKPKTYVRVMEFANALRRVGKHWYPAFPNRRGGNQALFLVWRILARFDNLVEQAHEVGHGEGYREGMQDGRQEGREEAGCHRVKAEEWEYRVVD